MGRLTYFAKASSESNVFSPAALESYWDNFRDADRVHAMVEDYRASGPGGIDLIRDAEDIKAGNKIKAPFKVLWGAKAVIGKLYDALGEWEAVCEHKPVGRAVPTGHYIPEGTNPYMNNVKLDSQQYFLRRRDEFGRVSQGDHRFLLVVSSVCDSLYATSMKDVVQHVKYYDGS